VRLVIARCTVDYDGRLEAHLPEAVRLIMVKADGCVAVHADGGAYKPLNWMNAPNARREEHGRWEVTNGAGERLVIALHEVLSDTAWELGVDPGLQKDGVEAHLQELLAAAPHLFGDGLTLVRREYPTALGPVDLLLRDTTGAFVAIEVETDVEAAVDAGEAPIGTHVAVEVKRHAAIDAVEQLARYLEFLDRDSSLAPPVRGVLAAQTIAPQARTLAEARGIRCVVVDYDELRGLRRDELRLF
jgi:endonuclease